MKRSMRFVLFGVFAVIALAFALAVTSCSSGGDGGNRLTVNDTAYEITDVTIWDGGDGDRALVINWADGYVALEFDNRDTIIPTGVWTSIDGDNFVQASIGGDGPPEYFADTSSVDIRISGTDGGVDGGVLTVEGTLNDSSSSASCSFSYSGPYIYESW